MKCMERSDKYNVQINENSGFINYEKIMKIIL